MPLITYQDRYPALVERLLQATWQKRLAHGWIVTGDKPVHLKKFALALLQILVCESRTRDGDACGTCSRCQSIEKERYPYLFELKPVSKTRQIRIEQIRELEHFLYLKTGKDRKFGLVYEADRMNDQSQNAFLKTLEEPAANSTLILVTDNIHGLLPTILSRCQLLSLFKNRYEYSMPYLDDLRGALTELRRGKGAVAAVRASESLIATLGKIQVLATEEYPSGQQDANTDLYSSETKKKIDDQRKAAIASQYQSARDEVLSVIHTWFAQEFMRSLAIAPTAMPHPELIRTEALPDPGNKRANMIALENLVLSEQLIEDLRFNIDEKLAVRDFCQQVCLKS